MSTDPEKGQGPTIDNNVNHSTEPNGSSGGPGEVAEHHGVQWPTYDQEDVQRAVDRFLGRGRPSISIVTGIKNILHSCAFVGLCFTSCVILNACFCRGEFAARVLTHRVGVTFQKPWRRA